jgi:GT2 family glycosyltransferase
MEKINASIVVYKTDVNVLQRAVESFFNSSITGKLTIIDNSPADTLRDTCNSWGTKYVFSAKNLGYGSAHNIALKESLDHAHYHLVLNPDVYFTSDTLGKLFRFMEENSQAGLVMPKVKYPTGELQMVCKLLPTPLDLASRRFFPSSRFHQRMNDVYELKESGYNQVMNVPFLSGCFMFFRTSALKKVGLFDERFFLYAEDTDLSRRMHLQFETLFCPWAEIFHVHARRSYKNFAHTLYNLKSAIQYFTKWGWLFDLERSAINRKARESLKATVLSPKVVQEVRAA